MGDGSGKGTAPKAPQKETRSLDDDDDDDDSSGHCINDRGPLKSHCKIGFRCYNVHAGGII